MRYMGSKHKLAKYLLPKILPYRKENQAWVEPFVGGGNIINKVTGIRYGNDTNEYLIALFIALQNGWIPPVNITKEQYLDIKNYPSKYPKELIGFVGFSCSFGGKWFGGYAADSIDTNYAARGSRLLVEQVPYIKDILFTSTSYSNMEIPPNSLIYCDPPYAGTTRYKDAFDHPSFWSWCRHKKEEGHTIFISEYTAPDDFECILEIPHKTILNKNEQSVRIEKLFIPK